MRFEDVDDNLVEIFMELVENRFPYVGQLKVKLVYDLKRKVQKGKLCLAQVEVANDKIRYFSKDDIALEGYDVVISFDKKAWQLANDADKRRIMSHELRHIFIDIDTSKVKILPHDISDFREEQKLNSDDPDWAYNLSTLVEDVYAQEKEMAKNPPMKRGAM